MRPTRQHTLRRSLAVIATAVVTATLAVAAPAGAVGATTSSSAAAPRSAPDATASVNFDGLVIGDEQPVGIPVQVPSIIDMAFGELDGRAVGYTATSSDGSLLNVIDIESNTFLKSAPMPSVIQVWKLEIAPNGKVYVAAIGKSESGAQRGELWIYDPVTNEASLAGVVPGASSNWSLVVDDHSNAYIGTYKSGEVVMYDAETGDFTGWGQVEGEEYVRSIEYHDGYIYAGTGASGAVVKINVADPGDRERISDPLLEIFGVAALPWAYDMEKVGDWLAVNFSDGLAATAFYNLETSQWSTTTLNKSSLAGTPTQNGNPGFTQLAPKDGKIYLTHNGTIAEVDLSGDEPTFSDVEIPFGLGMRGQGWVDLTAAGHPGEWLVTASRQGPLRALDIAGKRQITLPNVVQTNAGTPLHSMGLNPDGGIYMVTYPAGTGAVYDTSTGEFTNFPAEQAESMLTVGDATYFGLYPGGHIDRVVRGGDGRPSSSRVFTIGEGQDRPYYMVEDDGKLVIGSIPGYGMHQGALTIHDIASGETKVETDIVENQSIIGLAVRDGVVYGSTTIVGGLGSDPVADEAKLFTYDIAGGEKTGEYPLILPTGQKPKHISALSFGPDGNLWGTTDGWVFALDPETMQIIPEKSKNIAPDVTRYGMWRPMSFAWHDGKLLINVASQLTIVDPQTMEHLAVTTTDEEIARFIIAPLAPSLRTPGQGAQDGIYLFGSSDAGSLRVIPLSISASAPSPSLAFRSDSVVAGTSVDAILRGFDPHETVTLWLGKSQIGTAETDADGTRTVTAQIPADTAAGPHTVRVKDANGAVRAEAVLRVEPATPAPRITLTHQEVRAGDALEARLDGFAANAPVTLWLRSEPVLLEEATITADGSATLNLTIPVGTAAGEHTIVATDAGGTDLAQVAVQVTVTTDSPPVPPSDGGEQTGGLATTGAEGALWVTVGAGALAVILMGAWLMRRRKA
ncbi:hypothetical protein ACTU6U_13135 [Microbacterium sp. A196]|uniref:hypothetical protein n=1 Tax=Microbacterium sp. A196 TaxID=3457320 RepID=UPI003FD0B439